MKIDFKRTKSIQPNVTLIGFYPMPESEAELDRIRYESHYKTLCNAYGLSAEVIFEPEDIETALNRPVIAIEEYVEGSDSIELIDFVHPKNAIYISGCTRYGHPSEHFPEVTHKVHLITRHSQYPLYGDQVLAMAMYDRFNKQA